MKSPWVDDKNAALLTDLYELTMMRAYWAEGMHGEAVFSLFFRRLPEGRNYLLACGLDDVLTYLENLKFTDEALGYLRKKREFSDDFVDWLAGFRFTGRVRALPEGTPVFANEPLLEVTAPIAEAQLAETFVMNQMHMQTLMASKAARVKEAAQGRTVVDFGLRRIHGTDAGVKAARAFHIAGLAATSNVLAGHVYGVPTAGTMAHSYIQAHDDELDAYRRFTRVYPDTVLLVDTYDTAEGVRKVVELARELGDDFRVRSVRLDSGDLVELAFEARKILDAAGLSEVGIFASGSLDEWEVARIVDSGAPVEGFGVGTRMGVSNDAPYLDIAYKLVEYGGTGRLKLSPGKKVLVGPKQIYRMGEEEGAERDVIASADENLCGRPLLEKVFDAGERLPAGRVDIDAARRRAEEEIARLPRRIRGLAAAEPPYPVEISDVLRARTDEAAARVAGA